MNKNREFEIRGVNHIALVCKDMARTVEFYRDVLGMPLTKTIDLPNNMGQHFFFDIGNGDSLAFFWFPNARDGVPGVSAPSTLPGQGGLASAHGSMNHLAFDVPAEQSALRAAERVVWQCPLYWYSVPALLSLWFEKVLAHGWAYGSGGDALKGKRALWVTTTGAPEAAVSL